LDANWRAFVAAALADPRIYVFDGQLFHGDFTCLFLMECSLPELQTYVSTVLQLTQPLHPALIYCYQANVAHALEHIGTQRGQGWVESQVAWKLSSPYAQRRGWVGSNGWKQLYLAYRQVTDRCLQTLSVPTLAIETSAGEWSNYQTRIQRFFDLPTIAEPVWQRWFYKVYDYLVDIR
jgi:hypothetical protein